MRLVILLVFALAFSTAVFAYYETGWFIINATTEHFWTADQNPQTNGSLDENETHYYTWIVNASGGKGTYNITVNFTSTSPNVTGQVRSFNVTIYDKGDDGVIPNQTCAGCAFVLNGSNPVSFGTMSGGESKAVSWQINSSGPINSEWNVWVDFGYNGSYKSNTTKTHQPFKVRIVNYPWRDTTGYINESWGCRKMVNVTNETGGTGIVEIRDFEPASPFSYDNHCRIMNCSKEIRVTEIFANKSHQYVPYLNVSNENYQKVGGGTDKYEYCKEADIRFNVTLTAGQTKTFFIYYNNPLIDVDYSNPTGDTIFNKSYGEINVTPNETVWQGFYDSHIDFWWANSSDYWRGSTSFRTEANWSYHNLTKIGYKPQVQVQRGAYHFINLIPDDEIYFFTGHGGIDGDQLSFQINTYWTKTDVYSDDITDLSRNLSAKFVYISACYSGDNSSTKTCLTNWWSKAFTDRGADCFLGFQGQNVNMGESCPGSKDLEISDAKKFDNCFWQNITEGSTIRQAVVNGTDCARSWPWCGVLDSDCVHAILINSTFDGCDKSLIRG